MRNLKTWQSKFRTCYEVWEERNKRAMANRLTPEQEAQLAALICKRNRIYQEVKLLEKDKATFKEAFIMERNRLFPLDEEIKLFWQENGYSDMLVRKNGYVGLKSLDGGMALPAVYEDICLTYDHWEFFYQWLFAVKNNGKWGLVDGGQKVLIPLEYDRLFRRPGNTDCYILIKDGKQGVAHINHPKHAADIEVPVEMDAIYDVLGWDLSIFTKNEKWGWWFPDCGGNYENYCTSEFDEVFVQPIEEVWQMEDDEDEVFTVRKGDKYYDILYWTIK